jgi:hypothetical protein
VSVEAVETLLRAMLEDTRRANDDARLMLGILQCYHRSLDMLARAVRDLHPIELVVFEERKTRLEYALKCAEEWLKDAGNVLDIT